MAVCQYYLRGQCKFGDSCRNEHPPKTGAGFGTTSWGRPPQVAAATNRTDLPYNAANIAQDLNPKGEKPIWPLSSYAPFKSEVTLLGGLDVSPEELRVKAAAAVTAGNVNEYIQFEASQIAAAEQVYNAARTNTSQAFEQAAKQSRLVPNATASTSGFASTSSAFKNAGSSMQSAIESNASPSAFGAQTSSAPSAFGKSAFGRTGFGQPAFGQPAFGQTSTLGSTATSAFGQPAGGQPPGGQQASTTSAFGQPSFGQPNPAGAGGSSSVIRPASGAFSAFAGSGPSAFGAGATPSSNSSGGGTGGGFLAFAGQPSAFASAASGAQSSFGQQSSQATGTASVFGAPSGSTSTQTGNAFSALTSNSGNNGSIFGSFGGSAPATQPTPVQPVSVFGGQQSVFGNLNTNSTQPLSVFGQLGQTTSHLNVSPSSLIPTISMDSSNSGGSAFTTSPMSTIDPTASKQPSGSIDFAALISRTTYRPGSTPYDSQLPQNYSAMLPDRVTKAFWKEKFTWAWQDNESSVPEWIPPVDVR